MLHIILLYYIALNNILAQYIELYYVISYNIHIVELLCYFHISLLNYDILYYSLLYLSYMYTKKYFTVFTYHTQPKKVNRILENG